MGQLRQRRKPVDNFSTAPLLLVVGTQRVVTLHRRLARYFAGYLPLRVVEAPFEMSALVEVMAWPRHLGDDPAHAWLRGQILATAQPWQEALPEVVTRR